MGISTHLKDGVFFSDMCAILLGTTIKWAIIMIICYFQTSELPLHHLLDMINEKNSNPHGFTERDVFNI